MVRMANKRKYATHEEFLAARRAKSRARYAAMTPEEKKARYERNREYLKIWYAAMDPEKKAAYLKGVRDRYRAKTGGHPGCPRGIQCKEVIAQRQKDMTPDRRLAFRVLVKFWQGKI